MGDTAITHGLGTSRRLTDENKYLHLPKDFNQGRRATTEVVLATKQTLVLRFNGREWTFTTKDHGNMEVNVAFTGIARPPASKTTHTLYDVLDKYIIKSVDVYLDNGVLYFTCALP